MRVESVFVVCLSVLGCSSSEDRPDAMGAPDAADAGSEPDTGPPDSGRFGVACGTMTCTEDQYCHVTPTGPCTPHDGGTCMASEETCQKNNVPGCTTPRDRACMALPPACAVNLTCACLIAANPCPQGIATDCMKAMGSGATIECPFP